MSAWAPSTWEQLTKARSAAVERVVQTSQEQRFTGIVGEAGVGKSALLNAAMHRLQDSCAVLRLDLDEAWSPNRLAWRWARELARAVAGDVAVSHLDALSPEMWPTSTRNALLRLSDSIGHDLARLAEASAPPRGIGKSIALEGPIRGTLALAERQRVLLVIDHLEAPRAAGLSTPDSEEILWRLRARGQYAPHLHILVCARPPAQDLAAGPDAPYRLDGRWLTIDPPSPLEFSSITSLDAHTIEAVHARTSGHPRATVEVLEEFDAVVPAGGERPAIATLVSRIATRHVGLASQAMQHARSVHRIGGHLLLAVARGTGPYQATRELDAAQISDAMIRLHMNGLVRRAGPREWATADPRVKWCLAGTAPVSPPVAWQADDWWPPETHVPAASAPGFLWPELSDSQRAILSLFADGLTNPQIAQALEVTPNAVDASLRRIYRKLGVHGRAEALARLKTWTPQ
jgi:DNA-binding CsgD family transcriptional regulator/energy-coupling factor transporter ATP-binding protein EcfA2